jgi:hypothetical protein
MEKGLTTNKRSPGKVIAQFWDVRTKHNKIIGVFDTEAEAKIARDTFITNLNRYNGQVLPKVKLLPKGIQLNVGKKKTSFRADICMTHGVHKVKTVTIYLGSFNTLQEAIDKRKQYIDKLY